MADNRPIGVFDSGLGGLTVLSEISKVLPNEPIVYLGDTARVPYGTKSKETVIRYSVNNTRFLENRGVKMVVVACNTASAYAMESVEQSLKAPVVGVVEGGVSAAVKATRGSVGVIGTEATIQSRAYRNAILKEKPDAKVISKACPIFVALVEEGWVDNDIAYNVAERYLSELSGKIDTLVLGCTHYPLLKKVIGKVMGEGTELIDSAKETALLVAQKLAEDNLLADKGSAGGVEFLVTDSPQRSFQLGRNILGATALKSVDLVDIT